MTDRRSYEEYLDEFGERLTAVAARRRRRLVTRPAVLIAIGASAVAAATIGVAVVPGGGQLDPVARASEALAPSGTIIHMKLTSTMVATERNMKVPDPQTVELWSAADPARWRYVQVIADDVKVGDDEGFFQGREEFAFANGVQEDYIAQRDQLKVTTGFRDPNASRVPGLMPIDPERDIRPLLQRGELRDEGEATVDGRRVHRLVGETTSENGRSTRRVVYDVDAETFEPVAGELELTFPVPRRDGAGLAGVRDVVAKTLFHVDVYERLPDDAEHADVLRIKTTAKTRVTTRSVDDPPTTSRTTTAAP
ncbi:MAG TPA: hypothetical protein VFB41_06455 [Solirubrobacteraceae bacterium]|nr:hypothetical protein [Solirubrobacteraceae bacterium]